MLNNSQEIIIATSTGSKLLSFYSHHEKSKGLIILLHGWEGSSSSAYILSAGDFFIISGFPICRLNLRDHGDSHHLNEGLFMALYWKKHSKQSIIYPGNRKTCPYI